MTLKLNENIIKKAKEYAKTKKISLSDLIENYLLKLSDDKKGDNKITPLVKSLSGIISLPKEHNAKKDYSGYLTNKYK